MGNLFEVEKEAQDIKNADIPLAEKLRPQDLEQVVGQEDLFKENSILDNIIKTGKTPSIIFWGPAGTGKTTIARLIAKHVNASFEIISAIFTGVSDLKKIFQQAKIRKEQGKSTLLFVDEIHRFNKSQQDAFLPYVEDGTIILIGATTENPSFEVNSALLSRTQVITLKRLSTDALEKLLLRAEEFFKQTLPLTKKSREFLKSIADGDGRYLLNMTEQIFNLNLNKTIDEKELLQILQKRAPSYDKNNDEHYNLISALHKSVRGSDPDAALYWFCRMLEGGEDPNFIARRILRMASEDIGLADPNATRICLAAWQSYERLGSPEGELALAEALVYLATAPKSNAVYKAYNKARKKAKETGSLMPPKHILNAPTALMKDIGYGKTYIYDHDTEHCFSGQNYFPDEMTRESFYQPVPRGFERDIQKRLDYWHKLRKQLQHDDD